MDGSLSWSVSSACGRTGSSRAWTCAGNMATRVTTVLLALALECEADRVRVRYIAFHRLEDGGLQRGRVVTFEESQQSRGDRAKVGAAFGGAREQRLTGGSRSRQAVVATMLAGRVFFVGQRLDMRGIFDLRALVVAAWVTREHRSAIDDAYLARIGEHRQHASDKSVRHRIIIPVEADIRRLAHRCRDALEQWCRIVGQCQQAGSFLGEDLADRSVRFSRAYSVGSGANALCLGLAIEIVDILESPGGEEAVTHITNRAFRFFVAAKVATGRGS